MTNASDSASSSHARRDLSLMAIAILSILMLYLWTSPQPATKFSCPECDRPFVTDTSSEPPFSVIVHAKAKQSWAAVSRRDPASETDKAFFEKRAAAKTWEPFEPIASCSDETRVGDLGDGGKWVCGIRWLSTITANV